MNVCELISLCNRDLKHYKYNSNSIGITMNYNLINSLTSDFNVVYGKSYYKMYPQCTES